MRLLQHLSRLLDQAKLPHAVVTRCRSGMGDFQTNAAFRAAKAAGQTPLEYATAFAAKSDINEATGPIRNLVATGKGFLTWSISDSWLQMHALGYDAATSLHENESDYSNARVLIDMASPNMGKELHVGHLRGGVLGDTLGRLLQTQSPASITRHSHVGDIGAPVVQVMAGLLSLAGKLPNCPVHAWLPSDEAVQLQQRFTAHIPSSEAPYPHLTPSELSMVYARCKTFAASTPDPSADAATTRARDAFLVAARDIMQGLHTQHTRPMDAGTQALWNHVCACSRAGFEALWDRLGVVVEERPESRYLSVATNVLEELMSKGLAEELEDGAVVCWPLGRDRAPMVLRRATGGLLYTAIDLGALQQRLSAGHERLLYVVDVSQEFHFKQIFAMAELAGWTGEAGRWPDATLHHVAYGMVQGADGRKLSSRDGSDMTLQALLDEGQKQSLSLLSQSSFYDGSTRDQPEAAAARIASSAIRYHDLSHQRAANYVFRFDDALATRGNSALYAQYALARIRALREKAFSPGISMGEALERLDKPEVNSVVAATERELMIALLMTPDEIHRATVSLTPHVLTEHVFLLATLFHRFYEECPIVGHEEQTQRLWLCGAVHTAIQQCIELLGVSNIERL